MASRTQIRLQQLTGSLVDLKTEAQQYGAPATAAALTGSDLQDVLGAFGAALNRIHGAASDEPFNAAGGQFLNAATTDGTDGAGAILLSAANGGIGIAFANNKDLWIEGGQTMIVAEHNTANAIKLHADTGASQTIAVLNDEGTDEAAIALTSTAGGVDIDAAAAKDVNIAGGQVLISSKDNAASAITLTANQGADETIIITNTQGTDAAAISLLASAGGITIDGENAVSIKENGTEVIGITDARAVNIGVAGQATTILGTFNVDEAATFDNNVTITGNLDINGTTTTIDTTNLTVEDSIIALGVSGSGDYSATGDRGILFPRGAAGSFTAGLYFDGTDFKFASTQTGPTSGSFTAPANAAAQSTLRAGKINSENTTDATSTTDGALQTDGGLSVALDAVIGNDLHLLSNAAVLNLGSAQKFTLTHANANNTALVTSNNRLAFGTADEYIVGDGNDLSIFSGRVLTLDAETDIVLDAKGDDVILKSNGITYGTITKNGDSLILSGGREGGNLHLDSNGGVFALQAGGLNMNAIELESTGMKIGLFDGSSGNFNAGFLQLKDSNGNPSILSGTVGLRLDSGASAASIQLMTNDAANFIALKAPDGVGTSVTFALPGADGNANEVLITDGSATLSFANVGGLARKGVFEIASTLSAGSALATNSGADFGSDAITFGGVTGIQGRVVDVFVNGQLLTSGSAAARGNAEVDFEIASTTSLKFAFDLEPDDIVQVVKRG